jgi:hypothetical protein
MTDNLDIETAYHSGLESAVRLEGGVTDRGMSIQMTRSEETELVLLSSREQYDA